MNVHGEGGRRTRRARRLGALFAGIGCVVAVVMFGLMLQPKGLGWLFSRYAVPVVVGALGAVAAAALLAPWVQSGSSSVQPSWLRGALLALATVALATTVGVGVQLLAHPPSDVGRALRMLGGALWAVGLFGFVPAWVLGIILAWALEQGAPDE